MRLFRYKLMIKIGQSTSNSDRKANQDAKETLRKQIEKGWRKPTSSRSIKQIIENRIILND